MADPKPRLGARGATKVKTGCQTCKIRHKKCDEVRPACSQCSSTGRRCDLTQGNPGYHITNSELASTRRPGMSLGSLRPNLPEHMRNLTHAEARHCDYFRLVCAKDFALCWESKMWEGLLLRSVYQSPSIYHAALAIAALSRHHYSPTQEWYDDGGTSSAIEFSIMHYGCAIRILNSHLERSISCSELAILASILFVHVEAFQQFQKSSGFPNLISAHLNGGLAMVHSLKSQSRNIDHLETALHHIQTQIRQFEQFDSMIV